MNTHNHYADSYKLQPGFDPWGPQDDAWLKAQWERKRTALKVLLFVISSFFFLFIIAYFMRAQYNDWESLSAPWQPLASPWSLAVNTGMLIFSSLSLHGSTLFQQRGIDDLSRLFLLAASIFALLFLGGQLWLWSQLQSAGFSLSSNPANSFFYLLTGLHGVHLLVGLAVLMHTGWTSLQQNMPEKILASLSLCELYWHYLLGLWLVLFALLTSSQETLKAIASFCGL